MSEPATNKGAVAEQSQVRGVEMAPPSSLSTSDKLLRRIATLLFLLVAGMLTVFGYYSELDLYHGGPGGISRNPV
jgi:hypothetical protein